MPHIALFTIIIQKKFSLIDELKHKDCRKCNNLPITIIQNIVSQPSNLLIVQAQCAYEIKESSIMLSILQI